MTRRITRAARRLGVDLGGLDKRQQRRAVRRAATGGPTRGIRRASTPLPSFHTVRSGSPALELQHVTTALVDAGHGTHQEVAAHLARALHEPVSEPLQTAGPEEALEGTIVEPCYADALRLGSECLFSKFGFGDGDEPEAWLDYCDDHGIKYAGRDEWNQVLRRLVRGRLLPLLPAHVEVYDIDTIHNPIRASRVDGRQVRWDHNQAENSHYWPEVEIWISWPAVAAELEQIRR